MDVVKLFYAKRKLFRNKSGSPIPFRRLKTGSEEENVRKENEEFGVDAKALVDSRIWDNTSVA